MNTSTWSRAAFTAALGIAWLAANVPASPIGAALPTFSKVERLVEKQLATLADYRPGDLLSRKQVEPIFDELARLGWKVRDRAAILSLVPGDDEFFVKELRTSAGRKFMRDSGKYPLAYDRIDRLSRMIMGKQNVKALIAGPDGYKMIQYMTTTRTGQNLGLMLSQDPRGADFNSPTGRIYTAEALMKRLNQSYVDEQAAR